MGAGRTGGVCAVLGLRPGRSEKEEGRGPDPLPCVGVRVAHPNLHGFRLDEEGKNRMAPKRHPDRGLATRVPDLGRSKCRSRQPCRFPGWSGIPATEALFRDSHRSCSSRSNSTSPCTGTPLSGTTRNPMRRHKYVPSGRTWPLQSSPSCCDTSLWRRSRSCPRRSLPPSFHSYARTA